MDYCGLGFVLCGQYTRRNRFSCIPGGTRGKKVHILGITSKENNDICQVLFQKSTEYRLLEQLQVQTLISSKTYTTSYLTVSIVYSRSSDQVI